MPNQKNLEKQCLLWWIKCCRKQFVRKELYFGVPKKDLGLTKALKPDITLHRAFCKDAVSL